MNNSEYSNNLQEPAAADTAYIHNKQRELSDRAVESRVSQDRAPLKQGAHLSLYKQIFTEACLEYSNVLSPKELQIYSLAILGYANRDIARNTYVKTKTVRYHLTNIYSKLGLENINELISQHYLKLWRPKR